MLTCWQLDPDELSQILKIQNKIILFDKKWFEIVTTKITAILFRSGRVSVVLPKKHFGVSCVVRFLLINEDVTGADKMSPMPGRHAMNRVVVIELWPITSRHKGMFTEIPQVHLVMLH